MIATKAQWTHKLAKWVSRVLNPLVVLPPVLATASFQAPHGLIEGAKWLVERKGAIMIGSDTSGLEVSGDEPVPVHKYLLVDQGVHIGELHNLENLARDKTYRFTYIALTNRIKGATAGFALRPIAIR